MTHRYNGSQVLFRRAVACSAAARDQAERAAQEIAGGGNGMEPQQRARDAAIETVVLAQAAAESYINWIYVETGVKPQSQSWIARWGGLNKFAPNLGRPVTPLPSDHQRFFKELNAWRNYLVHGDEKARTALRAALKAQGHGDFADDAEVISLLSSDYAATVIERAEAAFIWAAHHTGVQAPFSRGAWISPSEGAARHRPERLRHGA